MATITKKQIRVVRTDDGTPPVLYDLPEKASSTWPANALINVDTNGYVIAATGDDVTNYWGIALNAGQNGATDGAKRALVLRLSPELVFAANALGASAADYVLLVGDVYGPMGLNYDDTPQRFHLDASEQGGADDRVIVIGLAPGSAVGDTNAELYFKFLISSIQNY